MPPKGRSAFKKSFDFLSRVGRKSEGKRGVSGGVWECGKPEWVFHHFHTPERGGKGGGDFLFKAP